jgi:hypothetical protein
LAAVQAQRSHGRSRRARSNPLGRWVARTQQTNRVRRIAVLISGAEDDRE